MSAVLQAVQPAQTLESLADAWADAKHAEDAAAKRRFEIEAQIIALTGERDEGSETRELADGRKLTVTAKVTRDLDETKYRAVMHRIPEEMRPVQFIEVARVDTKGVRWLAENRPDLYAILAEAMTVRKAKTAIQVRL